MLLNNKLKILQEFSKDYSQKIHGRSISKKIEMNQKTVSNILNELEKDNILKFVQEGKNKLYYLNSLYSNIKEIIQIIEIQKKINFLEKYDKLAELFSELEKRTLGVLIVFGSYASFKADKNSDLDVFILGKISDFEDLEEVYKIKINVIKSDKSKFNKKDIFIKEIIKNHVVLKGVEDFIELIW